MRDAKVSIPVFICLLLVFVVLLLQSVTTRSILQSEMQQLRAQQIQQKPLLEQAQNLRQQLESIAGATASLAEQGNQNAIFIREQLSQRGITIQPAQ